MNPMSEPLSREQVEMELMQLLNGVGVGGNLLAHDAAQRARMAALEQRLDRYNHWTPEHTIEEWLADRQRIVDAKEAEADVGLQKQLATLTAERDRLKEALRGVTVSLVAAIALLERGGIVAKRAAPSNKMFDQMLRDYKKSVKSAQAALRGKGG